MAFCVFIDTIERRIDIIPERQHKLPKKQMRLSVYSEGGGKNGEVFGITYRRANEGRHSSARYRTGKV